MSRHPFGPDTQSLFADAIAAQIAAAEREWPEWPSGDGDELAEDRHGSANGAGIARTGAGRRPDTDRPGASAGASGTDALFAAGRSLGPFMDGLDWYQIFDGGGIPTSLASGLMAAQIIGKRGPLVSSELLFGMFLLAPQVTYPLHQHAALEIYCVLSGTVAIRHGRAKAGTTCRCRDAFDNAAASGS